jgi:hypothetical protein
METPIGDRRAVGEHRVILDTLRHIDEPVLLGHPEVDAHVIV